VARRGFLLTLVGLVLVFGAVPNSVPGSAETASQAAAASAPSSDVPVVTGDLLNPLYFAHGACVMQGVEDRDKVFTMPLLGIPELSFTPTVEDIDPADVTWGIQMTSPVGVGAEISDGVLYIWGDNPSWSGHGEVVLTGVTSDGRSGSVALPVAVFRTDKTLVNPDGKKDYFVPWSPQLDINRILSVEEHMRVYGKADDSLLDRSVRFSPWRQVLEMHDISVSGDWPSSSGLSRQGIWMRVDETYAELRRIGCDTVNLWRGYSMPAPDSPIPVENLEEWFPGGPSLTEEEALYVINEAHLQGLQVILSPNVAEAAHQYRYFEPPVLTRWFAEYARLIHANARLAQRTGVEIMEMANNLVTDAFRWPVYANRFSLWNGWMGQILQDLRAAYDGPVSHCASRYHVDEEVSHLALYGAVDFLNLNGGFGQLATTLDPTLAEVETNLRSQQRAYYSMYAEFGKPMIAYEVAMTSYDGSLRDWDTTGWAPEGASYDPTEQALLFEAWFSTRRAFPSIYSYGLFCWGFWPASGGYGEVGHSARLKPAEAAIAAEFSNPEPPGGISIDGTLDDWHSDPGTVSLGEYPSGGHGIACLYAGKDAAYLYIAVGVRGALQTTEALNVWLDYDDDTEADMVLGTFWAGRSDSNPALNWMTVLCRAFDWSEILGIMDTRANQEQTVVECRIPWGMLTASASVNLRAVLVDNARKKELDRTSWLSLSRD
jgi:hypothetical protein